jgi:hypothetical protein
MSELTKEFFEQQISKLATKDELHDLATKEDIRLVQSELKDIKETVARIDKRDKEDSNAFAKDILKLQKDVKQLQLKSA